MGISLLDATQVSNGAIRTQYGLTLPPGARVAAYVRSSGVQDGDDGFIATNLVATLAQGLARVRAGRGDFVVCLPGHAESVLDGTTFSGALIAGTRIIGVGRGSQTPTFTWNATAAQWLVAQNDVQVAGLRLDFSGIAAVVSAISVTGTDFSFVANEVIVSSAAKAPGAGISFSAAASRGFLSGNLFRGLATAIPTTLVVIAGANLDTEISDNEFNCPAAAAIGHVAITGAALGVRIFRNQMYNTAAASTACISIANFASDGHIADNRVAILTNGVASATGISFTSTGSLIKCNQNFCTDEPRASGLLSPPAAAS